MVIFFLGGGGGVGVIIGNGEAGKGGGEGGWYFCEKDKTNKYEHQFTQSHITTNVCTFLYLKDTKQNGPVHEVLVLHRRVARTHADLRICAEALSTCIHNVLI